ncbi:hypothetical protein C8D97_10719 [Pleionea mediterranea]|uniref:UPF0276 protein C8D97_10719 n=2 Tax=Pleionea mediterranea TaxID=523701 RepID=A0A316FLT8_9GAMM|nr:hypothetical protein C8D97_10719 [Pleionea mediterranea]
MTLDMLQQTNNFLGFGLGLRTQHFQEVITNQPNIDWFEILSENFMVAGGKPRYYLDRIKERYPIVMHGVSLSIGSTDPLDWNYLKQLKTLINHVDPPWFSDHLCWTSFKQINSHDLLPLPYTDEAIKHLSERIRIVQDFIGKPMLLENVSSYLSFKDSEMTEWEFLNTIRRESGCFILFDVNNIYVSSRNHDFDPMDYINGIDVDSVLQIHLAGHHDFGSHIIDTHDHDVCDSVWELYERTLRRFGPVSTMIERDDNIPELNELISELDQARNIYRNVFSNLSSENPTTKPAGLIE